mgnify:CR=1 FL=1
MVTMVEVVGIGSSGLGISLEGVPECLGKPAIVRG